MGGTASAVHAKHRFSRDADHVLTDLRSRFDDVLAELESMAGWKTARVQRPVQILGSLDGIKTGIRQLIRDEPLETTVIDFHGDKLTLPTEAEILRIKGVLILRRNATRDYLDFAALADHMGDDRVVESLQRFAAPQSLCMRSNLIDSLNMASIHETRSSMRYIFDVSSLHFLR